MLINRIKVHNLFQEASCSKYEGAQKHLCSSLLCGRKVYTIFSVKMVIKDEKLLCQIKFLLNLGMTHKYEGGEEESLGVMSWSLRLLAVCSCILGH